MQYDKTRVIPVNAYSAGVAVLDEQNRLLMVQENQPKAKGLWHIPAGSVESNESYEEAALREAFEETGLKLKLECFLNAYVGIFDDGDYVLRLVWLARADEGAFIEPVFEGEINDCKYISKPEFDVLFEAGKVRMYHTKMIFEDALKAKSQL